MKNLFNQTGFSLVQGMILAGVVAGSSLVATRILTDQKLAQKGAETRDLVEELHNTVYTTMQNRNHCKATIMRNGLQGALGTSSTAQTLNSIAADGMAPDQFVVEVGKAYMNNNVKVEGIALGPQIGGQRVMEITYERLDDRDADAKTKKGYGAKRIKKSIVLRIQKEPMIANTFSACYAVTSKADDINVASGEEGNDIAKQVCEELNRYDSTKGETPANTQKAFVWDEALSICKPNGQCPGDEVFTGIDSNGTVKCRPLAEWIDMANILDPNPPSGCGPGKKIRFQVDNTNKKVRLICE